MTAPSLPTSLVCAGPQLGSGLQGIAYIGVDEPDAQLRVTFERPLANDPYLLQSASYALIGGTRIFPRILGVSVADAATVVIALDQIGDFSIYTLIVSGPTIDPFFATRPVRFRLECDAPYDCAAPVPAPAAPAAAPVSIDYLTKDYTGFRQALLDFIGTRFPGWTERNEADLGMMLLELFAATADTLSYQQDRVGSEAFLATATQRRSVADHLALVGYHLDEGAAAATFVQFDVSAAKTIEIADPVPVGTPQLDDAEPQIVFETLGGAQLDPLRNEFTLYTWGQDPQTCTLPQSARWAALIGSAALVAGDYLAFRSATANDVVRLSANAEPAVNVESGATYSIVRWSTATPLSADYLVAATRVLGNVVPAINGRTRHDTFVLTAPPIGPRARLQLTTAPLAFLDAATMAHGAGLPGTPAAALPPAASAGLLARERRSSPCLRVTVGAAATEWSERVSLLDGPPDAPAFSLKVAADGTATLLFGDGAYGYALPANQPVDAHYRVGGGAAGNLAADQLSVIVTTDGGAGWCVAVTNVVPATGGRDRETIAHAKRYGPKNFLGPLVAVTADDYANAALAATDAAGAPLVQRAIASFRWTGSWLTVTLAVDPADGETFDAAAQASLASFLASRRLTGYDLEIVVADYVPLQLSVEVRAQPGAFGPEVAARVTAALIAFFAPTNFTFGDAVYVSGLYATIAGVPGVAAAAIVTLAPYRSALAAAQTAVNLRTGALTVGTTQIVRLDNDPNYPEHGLLTVTPIGSSAA